MLQNTQVASHWWGLSSFFHGALLQQKPYGLLDKGEEWDMEREARPTCLVFTQLLTSATFIFHGALRAQKPYGLLGKGEEWDSEPVWPSGKALGW